MEIFFKVSWKISWELLDYFFLLCAGVTPPIPTTFFYIYIIV